MILAHNCKIETISTVFRDILASPDFIFELENGTKRLSQALSTVTTIKQLNANNKKIRMAIRPTMNKVKPLAQHYGNVDML